MKRLKNQYGSSLIEAILCLVFLIQVLGLAIIAPTAHFAKLYLKRQAYKATQCIAATDKVESCENKLNNSVLWLKPFIHNISTRLRKTDSVASAKIQISIGKHRASFQSQAPLFLTQGSL